jgi:DNA-binding response OmpR family regulator
MTDEPLSPDQANDPETTPSESKPRVLIVDDDPDIIESIRFALKSKEVEVMIARDGNQGLAMAEKEEPDLVILDMMMPKRSGFLVLEQLRQSSTRPMRFIMITANEGNRHKQYAEILGVDDYIRKPFPMERLLGSVDRLLSLDEG